MRRFPWLYFTDKGDTGGEKSSFSTYKYKLCPRPGKLSRSDKFQLQGELHPAAAGGGGGGASAADTDELGELERVKRSHTLFDDKDDDDSFDPEADYKDNATVAIKYTEGCEFPCTYRDTRDTSRYDERSGVAYGCTRIEEMEKDAPWIACNSGAWTEDMALLCQIGGFQGPFAENFSQSSPTNPSGDVSKVALATNEGEDVTCHHYLDQDFWNVSHHPGKSNATVWYKEPHGTYWSIAQIHRQLVSKRQEAVLLEETTALLKALEAMAASDEDKISRKVCDVLVASKAFNADWLQCGTEDKAKKSNQTFAGKFQQYCNPPAAPQLYIKCQTMHVLTLATNLTQPKTFAGLLKAVIQPAVEQTSDEANETRVVQMKTKYICDWNNVGVPQSTSRITDLTGRGPKKCWYESDADKCTQIDIEVSHACCCHYDPSLDNITADQKNLGSGSFHNCFANYSYYSSNDRTKDKCDYNRKHEKKWLAFAAGPVILVLWLSERWEQRHSRAFSISQETWFSDVACMFGLIPPLNFMENRKGSIIVSCFFGTLASLIFREVAIPTKEGFAGALYWLFLLYPMFICRTATNKKLGSFVGICYCVMFAYLLSFQLVCNFMVSVKSTAGARGTAGGMHRPS